VMFPHALTPSAATLGLENVKLLRRNKAANALFAHLGKGDFLRTPKASTALFLWADQRNVPARGPHRACSQREEALSLAETTYLNRLFRLGFVG